MSANLDSHSYSHPDRERTQDGLEPEVGDVEVGAEAETEVGVEVEVAGEGGEEGEENCGRSQQVRNRTTQSCLNCHTSKRKCDRKRPCQRCIQLGLTGLCVYEVDSPVIRAELASIDRAAEPERKILKDEEK